MRPDMTAAEFVRALLDHADMMDRVARINAGLVLASGEPMRDDRGYRHPRLLDGHNVVRAYLLDVARDLCIDVDPDR